VVAGDHLDVVERGGPDLHPRQSGGQIGGSDRLIDRQN
jgi:hypothetical protein